MSMHTGDTGGHSSSDESLSVALSQRFTSESQGIVASTCFWRGCQPWPGFETTLQVAVTSQCLCGIPKGFPELEAPEISPDFRAHMRLASTSSHGCHEFLAPNPCKPVELDESGRPLAEDTLYRNSERIDGSNCLDYSAHVLDRSRSCTPESFRLTSLRAPPSIKKQHLLAKRRATLRRAAMKMNKFPDAQQMVDPRIASFRECIQ
mmetsp:Transcript_522/g.1121  ORF Transcript_522/g.1121 Transcript_522/m.1121 type:complete len:206 (-) Transcript_522:189-806(-)